jgi:ribosomal protein S12 methylthiotransferase accessory factor
MRGTSSGGRSRWVPAEAVHIGLSDPGRPLAVAASSSGLAAGSTAAEAADRALRELIERDAFMWTWVQGISRERIDPSGLDSESAALAAEIEALGYEVALVNLTLDTKPVVMAVLHRADRLHVATACRERPLEAAAKALEETALVLAREGPREPPELRAEDVRTAEDHMWLYLRPELVRRAGFLWASDDTIGLADVAGAPGSPADVLAPIGEAVLVDLTSERTAPFHVVRSLVPGLVPLSFGWDREPLGMTRLARPATAVDGRCLGAALDLESAAPILPHPFP